MMRLRYGENFAGTTQAVALWRDRHARRRARDVPSGRPCARLGADRGRVRTGCASSPPATTRTSPDPTCAPFELVPCDVFITEATFGLPVFRHGDPDGEIGKLLHSVALFPGARASRRRLFARQGAARDRADPQGRLRQADLPARRDGDDHALLREPRHRARRAARGARRQEGRACRRDRALPAVGVAGGVVAALPRSGVVVRVGLDAGARAGAPARRRAAAGDLRPRRLGRPHRHHRRDRRAGDLGHARPGGRAGALVHGSAG